MKHRASTVALAAACVVAGGGVPARAGPFEQILDEDAFRIESVRLRFSHFDQHGLGYQSQADVPPGATGPGSEAMVAEQPQLEIVAKQGKKLTHRIWIPVDIITAASPDATDDLRDNAGRVIDTISSASRSNEAFSIEVQSKYQMDPRREVSVHAGFHLEETFRSFDLGVGASRSFADDNAVLAASVNQIIDWFDKFNPHGDRLARSFRSSTNANLSLTQLLSPTTVGALNYGVTVQVGELGNTWNGVPQIGGAYLPEVLPRLRQRHALVGRLAQWLPWHGALKLFYRFYVDDWGLTAHTAEAELYQHLGPWLYLKLNYRFHYQTGVDFFTTLVWPNDIALRTGDSDLAPFYAQTIGGKIAVDLRIFRKLRDVQADFGYERYFRSNNMQVNIYTCSLGFRF